MTFDAIVVGAGPAGSAAATVLAQSRARVLLVEKDTLPRAKVCGELLSAGTLSGFERLGVLGRIEELGPEHIESGEIFPSRGRASPSGCGRRLSESPAPVSTRCWPTAPGKRARNGARRHAFSRSRAGRKPDSACACPAPARRRRSAPGR